MMTQTVSEAVRQIASLLREIDAQQEARVLIEHVTGLTVAEQLTQGGAPVTMAQQTLLWELAAQRRAGKPLQYVLGEWQFMSLPMRVREGVLIPREDTQVLVQQSLRAAQSRGYETALDLCCGSGCIAIALAVFGKLTVTAADISSSALALTKENASRNNVPVVCVQTNLFENIHESFDMIVSNPPYIPSRDIDALDSSVKDFEPRLALDGGEDGLDFYRAYATHAADYLNEGGMLFVEVGINQAAQVAQLLTQVVFKNARIVQDSNGIDRVVSVQRQHNREDVCSKS